MDACKVNCFEIRHSNLEDLELIFDFYSIAIEYQKPRFKNHWPQFSREMVKKELEENRQFQLLVNGEVACVWAVAFSDPEIWGERNREAAVYLHRIATHTNYRGRQLVKIIANWAIAFGKASQKDFVRMDTVGDNKKLIAHYQKCGFTYLGLSQLKNTNTLPAHYYNAVVSLFEIKVTL